ncbi:MAG: dapF [Clostridium sp.]|nr:dapF [Clostridium sp.]
MVACNRLGLINKKAKVSVPGGVVEIEICDDAVYMTGGAAITFRGVTDLI